MNENHQYVEQRTPHAYTVKWGNAERASFIGRTQKEAIDYAKEHGGGAPIHVERVKKTGVGFPDEWRHP